MTDFELILVDDGSTDSSPMLCDEYTRKDKRIKTIHMPNGGPSAARNRGLADAAGEYIGFVDSDDWIEPRMYETLFNRAKVTAADIVFCDFLSETSSGNRCIKPYPGGDSVYGEDEIASLFLPYFFGYKDSEMNNYKKHCPFADYASYIWLCIYRSDMLKSANISFPSERVYYNEDNLFNLSAVFFSRRISHCARYFYHYRDYGNSLTKKFNEHYFNMRQNKYDYLRDFLKRYDFEESYLKRLNNKICIESVNVINYYVNSSTLKISEKYNKIVEIVNSKTISEALGDLNLEALSFSTLKLFLFFARKKACSLLIAMSFTYLSLRRIKK